MLVDKDFASLANRLQSAGHALRYPPTPDLAVVFSQHASRFRRSSALAWGLALLIVALVTLLAVPEVRARVLEFFQIGGVRIIVPKPTETLPASVATSTLFPHETISSILDLEGQTTMDEAIAAVDFPIDLPTYPAHLGDPDKVFLQHTDTGDVIILAWLDDRDAPRLILYILGPAVSITKGPPEVVEQTHVNGTLAIWALGDYMLFLDGSQYPAHFVHGPVLIWERAGLTYRIEAPLSLEEMVLIAESIGSD